MGSGPMGGVGLGSGPIEGGGAMGSGPKEGEGLGVRAKGRS